MRYFHFRVLSWLVLGAVIGCLPALAQQQTAPDAPAPLTGNNSAQDHQQTPTNANPFPEAKSQKAADAAGAPANTPGKGATNQHKQSPSEANPFPEEESSKAADAANGPTKDSGSSSSHFDLNRLNVPAGSEARISNGEGGYIHSPQLAAKDVKVGNFYLSTHDYKGAYDRFLEATRVAPEDGNAVFGLAESARGLNKTEEAITNYNVYLQAFPKGKKAKDAERALAELTSPRKK